MFAKTYGATTLGVDGLIIDVEVDSASGLPGFDIVGLADTAVKESKERVRTAIRNSGIRLRQEKVTINLAPADIKKDSSGLDLPIAVGLLAAYGVLPQESVEKCLFAAELSLEGECRGVRGVLPMAVKARDRSFEKIFVARENAEEALLVEGLQVYGLKNLGELVRFLTGQEALEPAASRQVAEGEPEFFDDFSDVQGQYQAKRALEIAAAGGHNVLMVGVPGSGKTMLARRLSSILPELTREEALEVTKIYSVAGLLRGGGLIRQRPFRSPHHTTSMVAMIGGGSVPRPGEVTLAHHGVLFLDELPEFTRGALEILRQPMEDKEIHISRAAGSCTFPADFLFAAAMNPCKCGFYPDRSRCSCSEPEVRKYLSKISQPLIDRIDISVEAQEINFEDLRRRDEEEETSAEIRGRVTDAVEIQKKRYEGTKIKFNADLKIGDLKRYCPVGEKEEELLREAFSKLGLSVRAYHRILRCARTIADLYHSDRINTDHLAEAIAYRSIDKRYWHGDR